MEKEETIGFHKGALSTLIKEREELVRMVTIVDQLVQAHKKGLEDLGVSLEQKQESTSEKSSEERSP
tara:strand:- start:29 stop:229 length:201 start_codon:yes stop_codon:yes gene_type:complete